MHIPVDMWAQVETLGDQLEAINLKLTWRLLEAMAAGGDQLEALTYDFGGGTDGIAYFTILQVYPGMFVEAKLESTTSPTALANYPQLFPLIGAPGARALIHLCATHLFGYQ